MSDHDPTDDERQFVRDLFNTDNLPPADIVPGSGPTREDYLHWNDSVGTGTQVLQPGEPVLDVDGIPTAMPPAEVVGVYFGGAVVTRAELERVGLTPDDVPNLKVIDPRQETP